MASRAVTQAGTGYPPTVTDCPPEFGIVEEATAHPVRQSGPLCRVCGEPIPGGADPCRKIYRSKEYCSPACRQKAYRARRTRKQEKPATPVIADSEPVPVTRGQLRWAQVRLARGQAKSEREQRYLEGVVARAMREGLRTEL